MRNFDWDYLLDGVICSCYWMEPEAPPVLTCSIPEVHQIPLFSLFSENKNLLNEVGRFAFNPTKEDLRWVKQLTPLALNLVEGFSPPLPVWLTWNYNKYDEYFWLLERNGWYD